MELQSFGSSAAFLSNDFILFSYDRFPSLFLLLMFTEDLNVLPPPIPFLVWQNAGGFIGCGLTVLGDLAVLSCKLTFFRL